MPHDDSNLSDHDLLLKLLWTVGQIKVDLSNAQAAELTRVAALDAQLVSIKKDYEELCAKVDRLELWRVKVVAYGTAISLFISAMMRMFWK